MGPLSKIDNVNGPINGGINVWAHLGFKTKIHLKTHSSINIFLMISAKTWQSICKYMAYDLQSHMIGPENTYLEIYEESAHLMISVKSWNMVCILILKVLFIIWLIVIKTRGLGRKAYYDQN